MTIEISHVGIFEVSNATGESLVQAVRVALEEIGLDLVNCFGFASDGASNMILEINSIWSRIIQFRQRAQK